MNTSKLYRVAKASEETGTARQTIQSAMERGEIATHLTGCGLPLVDLNEVRRWVARSHTRSPGRKPKK